MLDVESLRAETPGAEPDPPQQRGAALLSQPTLRRDDRATSGWRREIGGYEAAGQPRTRSTPPTTRSPSWSVAGARRSRCSTTPPTPGTRRSTRCPCARATASSPAGPSTAATCWPTCRWPGGPAPRWSWCPNDAHGQLDLAALADLVDERTQLIGVSHVPTCGGLVNPAAEIGRIARAAGALYLLDATQSAGQFPVDVADDRLRPAHRYRPQVPARPARHRVPLRPHRRAGPARPVRGRDRLRDLGRHRRFTWADGARRFETWEHSYVNLLGLGAAVRQALGLGLDAIGERAARARRPAARPARGAAWRHHPRPRPDPLCAIVTATVEPPAGEVAAALGPGRGQRHHHRARGQPARHRGPRRPPAGPALPALLQHRGRDRPRHRGGRRHGEVTVRG